MALLQETYQSTSVLRVVREHTSECCDSDRDIGFAHQSRLFFQLMRIPGHLDTMVRYNRLK
jgi:hypothetical protein